MFGQTFSTFKSQRKSNFSKTLGQSQMKKFTRYPLSPDYVTQKASKL